MRTPTGSSLAAVFHGPDQPLRLQRVALPSHLGPGEVLVKISCCTVCGSDLHTIRGLRTEPTPCILGHEIVGRVAAIGAAGAQDLRGRKLALGERVVWSVAASCHDNANLCNNCQRGLPQKCEQLSKYGHAELRPEWSLSGGLAEYCHLLAGSKLVILDDDSLMDEVACLATCAVATAQASVRKAGGIAGKRVLVLGAGMLGLTATAIAATENAARVVVSDVALDRLKLAGEFGGGEIIEFNQLQLRENADFDVVFEMSGSLAAAQQGLKCTSLGGTLILVGTVLPTEPLLIAPEQLIRRLQTVAGVHNYHPDDLLAAVDFLKTNHTRFPFAKLIDRSFHLSEIEAAIHHAQSPGVIRVAVKP